jgi:acyl carrier protein
MHDLTERLETVFCIQFGYIYKGQLTAETTMDDIPEWDSMSFLQLILALENEYDISFSPNESAQMFTYGNIIRILAEKLRR